MAADPIDERYDEIVRGLRALPGAPAELRGHVLELAAVADTPRPRWRGLRIALGLSLAVVAAVAAISLTSGGTPRSQQKLAREAASPAVTRTTHAATLAPRAKGTFDRAGLPITPGRLTEVHASLRLRVSSIDKLSKATARAMRITRGLGGILQLRQLAAQLRAKLAGQLTPEERVAVQARLDAVRGQLRAKTGQHAGTLRQGRLSTFELELTTRKGAAAAPSHPGRIGRAAKHAFSALSKTIAGLLYVLIVLSPLLVLAAAALWGARYRRRRVEQRLLARA